MADEKISTQLILKRYADWNKSILPALEISKYTIQTDSVRRSRNIQIPFSKDECF